MKTSTCQVCSHPFSHAICFVLQPCNHVVCVKCFHQIVPASYTLQCPCSNCKEWVTSSTLMEIEDGINECKPNDDVSPAKKEEDGASESVEIDTPLVAEPEPNATMTSVQEVMHFEPDEQMDPFRHWAMKKPDLYSGFLYVAFRCNDEDASFYKANFKAANSTVFMDDNSSDDLVKIFARVLHPLLFRKDFFAEQMHQGDANEPQYQLPSFQQQEQQQLALRSLYALSSGHLMSTEEQEEISSAHLASHDSIKRKAIECAKDLAKELLLSKKKTKSDRLSAAAATKKMKKVTTKQQEWRKLLSPVDENKQKLPANGKVKVADDYELQTQIPYMLGFLLLGASWVFSN